MQAEELSRLAEELGLDVVGAAPASRLRRDRAAHPRAARARALRGHALHDGPARGRRAIPSTLLEGARTVVSAALCYWADGEAPPPGHGRLPRYTWWDAYAVLRERLDELGRRLGGEYRVLVDANQHVDREAAARSGVGFYGKNTMLITRRFGSWVVLGTLVTDVELEATPPLDADCGSCTLCIDACPTGALDEPGVLDATRCLSYWTQSRRPDPRGVPRARSATGLRLRHLPGRLPVEPRGREAAGGERAAGRRRAARLARRLARGRRRGAGRAATTGSSSRATTRATCAGTRSSRSATPAASTRALAERYADGDDPLLREHAEWALERLGSARERRAAGACATSSAGSAGSGSAPSRSRSSRSRSASDYPSGYELWAWVTTGVFAVGALRPLRAQPARVAAGARRARIGLAALAFDFAVVSAYILIFSFEHGLARPAGHVPAARRGRAALRDRGRARPRRRERAGAGRSSSGCARTGSRRARYHVDYVTLQLGIELLLGLIVGWLVLRLLGQTDGRRGRARPRPSGCATSSAGAPTCSRPPTAARGRSARRSSSTRPSTRSSARCAGSCRSTGSRSCSARTASAQVMAVAGAGADERAAAGLRPADPRHAARGAAAHEPDGLPARHERARTTPRRTSSSRSACAAGSRRRCSQGARAIGMLSLVRREPDAFSARGDRARRPARPARGDRGAEHPRLRGRAQDRRGAAPPLGSARRLRLARLARAAHARWRR